MRRIPVFFLLLLAIACSSSTKTRPLQGRGREDVSPVVATLAGCKYSFLEPSGETCVICFEAGLMVDCPADGLTLPDCPTPRPCKYTLLEPDNSVCVVCFQGGLLIDCPPEGLTLPDCPKG